MKKSLLARALLLLSLSAGCGQVRKDSSLLDSADMKQDSGANKMIPSVRRTATHTVNGTANLRTPNSITMVERYLNSALKDDLSKKLIDTPSRKFIFQEVDLNRDKKNEIFIGLTGPYFCGSGGCTCFLLNDKGNLITRFTVVQYPILIVADRTNGWNDLIVQSHGKYHTLKFDGQRYPSNPSVQPSVVTKSDDKIHKVLDNQQKEYDWHVF